MQEENFLQIKGKIVSGVFALTTRTLVLQIISFTATFILTILLTPETFGVFFVVSAIIAFLSYFSDIGLAAALIQKRQEPTQDELATSFTLQQILVGSLVLLSLLGSSYISGIYGLNSQGTFLFQALVISFFLSSLKTIPSILLERSLNFKLLVVPQIAENLAFYIVAIILAYYDFQILSFAWAALVRGVIGVITIYIIAPWRIRFLIKKDSIRGLLTFGIPFQLNSILALVKDDLMTIFLGRILPFAQVGYIGWAKKWAEAPLRLIMDNIIKVTFPAFSRLQQDKKMLGKAINKSFFFLSLFIFPATIGLVFFVKPMISIIPRYSKWEPALASFYLFAFSSLFAAFSSPVINALNAIGKIKITLVLMILWTVLTWTLAPLFISITGFEGYAISAFIISFTGIIPIFIIKRFIRFSFIKSIYKGFLSSVLMGFIIGIVIRLKMNSITIAFSIFTAGIAYILIVYFWMKEEIAPYIPWIRKK